MTMETQLMNFQLKIKFVVFYFKKISHRTYKGMARNCYQNKNFINFMEKILIKEQGMMSMLINTFKSLFFQKDPAITYVWKKLLFE